jgi:putative ABC transport system permease protein
MRKDIAYALRSMARNPGLCAVAVLTLALGIGANTAMFSVIHAVLLRPLPLRDPDRLVGIWAGIPRLKIQGASVEYNTFVEWWRARSRSFEALAAHSPSSVNLTSGDQPQRVRMLRVSGNHFSMLGVRPSLGRDFLAAEDQPGAPRVALLSNGLWKRRFGADPAILGRSIELDRNSYTVVGVLPPDFDLNREDIFTPIAHSGARAPGMPTVGTYARLKPGVSVQAAQAEIDALCRGWVAKYRYPKDWGARVWPLREYLVRDVRASVLVLGVAVALVLLIACANVANLLLARAGARRQEMAVRTALGASRSRIIRQLLTESALLGALAAALGLALAWGAVRALVAVELPFPFLSKVSLDAPVLWFTAAAALLTTMLFGLAPAFAAAHSGLVENLKEGGRGAGESPSRSRFRAALVVAEVALALLLVIGATLAVRSLARLVAVNPGFNAEGVLTALVALPQSGYPEPARRVNFFNSLSERLAAVPGVQAAAMVSHLPFGGGRSGSDILVEGAPPPEPGDQSIAFGRSIHPDYFRALQIRLLRGRYFTAADPASGPVAIVNETLARRGWPGQDPVGKRFGLGRRGEVWITVVGVAADIRNTSLAEEPDAEYFVPYKQVPHPGMALVIRTTLDPMRLASTIRAAVGELDKEVPISEVVTLAASISRSTSARRFSVSLLSAFALLALLLAAIGIYGLVSYSVARRTREIGVRMALGASPRGIARMVVGRAQLLSGAGILLGLAASLALTRLLRSMLFGVSATDPGVFAAAALFLLAVSALAAYLPARRASRVDPLVALHHE